MSDPLLKTYCVVCRDVTFIENGVETERDGGLAVEGTCSKCDAPCWQRVSPGWQERTRRDREVYEQSLRQGEVR